MNSLENVALAIEGLSKRYERFHLNNIHLRLPVGSVVGLVGQNGAGKSTLIKTALGLVRKNAGRVSISCVSGDPSPLNIRAQVGYVPESITFYEWMTLGRLVRFVSSYYPSWDQEYCASLLERFELDPDKQIKHLSKGMRVKLALLLALAHRPPVLILDEPTAGLDPVMKHHFLQELRRIISTGATRAILISSHILGEIEQVADRIAVLRAGVLVSDMPTRVMLDGWKKVVFLAPQADGFFPSLDRQVQLLNDGRRSVITREQEVDDLTDLLRSHGASSITVTAPDLQEVFVQVA
jgi:ABC-2 type transport system ATP-binding protein